MAYTVLGTGAALGMFDGRPLDSAIGLTLFAVVAFLQPVALFFVSIYAVPSGLAMGFVACAMLRGSDPTRESLRVLGLAVVGTALVMLASYLVGSRETLPWVGIYAVPLVAIGLVRWRLLSQRSDSDVR